MENKKRIFGLDLVKTVALFLVVLNHVFGHKAFISVPLEGMRNFILLFIRHITLLCVPLFIILTGYSNSEKTLGKNRYKAFKKVLISYVVISILCILYRICIAKEALSIEKYILGIFNFTADGYAWYVEMYIGLFLLIPYLNIVYKNLETKKNKQNLIIVLLLLTSIPPTVSQLTIGAYHLEIFPNWWQVVYPLLYYYIGCYIKEYKITINSYLNIMWIFIILFIQTVIIFFYIGGGVSQDNLISGYQSTFIVAASTLTFILLYKQKIRGNIIRKVTETISKNSLEIYLLSYIADRVVYYDFKFMWLFPKYSQAILISVPVIFTLSFISAVILNNIIKGITFIKIKIKNNHEKIYSKKEYY